MKLQQKELAYSVAIAALAVGWGCGEEPFTPQAELAATIAPTLWVGCPAGGKFTGGGRIDVEGEEKWTFGFNLHDLECDQDIKGQMEVNHHPTQTKFHSTEWTRFASFEMDGGRCVEWEGVFRAKHGNGDWHEHDATGDACDYGEPGSSPGEGPDTFRFNASGGDEGSHANTHRTPLTGGNIQAH
jgi:hypothetical protein